MSRQDFQAALRQLRLWVHGQSVHDREANKCCPDLSCCWPELQAPLEEREHFYRLAPCQGWSEPLRSGER